jgi:hypothetical protein
MESILGNPSGAALLGVALGLTVGFLIVEGAAVLGLSAL